MHAPNFWYNSPQRPGFSARILAPLGQIYGFATAWRVARPATLSPRCPVICIGNLNAGGTGKTPTVIALLNMLIAAGRNPHVLSKGYGGTLTGPIRVDPAQHRAEESGDEPLLLAAFAPTWVAKSRSAGVKAAQQAGADVILLDDGFQDPSIKKTVSIVVVDAALCFGNGRCIPAGPLRETIPNGLRRADIILSIGEQAAQTIFAKTWGHIVPCRHFTAQLSPLQTGLDWSEGRYFAFAGIGQPEKFFTTIKRLGAHIVGTQPLGDHQILTPALLKRLQNQAQALDAQLVTTEKDAVRLPQAFKRDILTVPVRLEISELDALQGYLLNALNRA